MKFSSATVFVVKADAKKAKHFLGSLISQKISWNVTKEHLKK